MHGLLRRTTKMAGVVYSLVLLTVAIVPVEAEWCWISKERWYSTWCTYGCCGESLMKRCCSAGDFYELTGGDYAGIIVGSIIALALVVGGIALVIFFCTTCCRQPARVVYSNGVTNPAMVTTSVASYPAQSSSSVTQTTYQQHHPASSVVYKSGYTCM